MLAIAVSHFEAAVAQGLVKRQDDVNETSLTETFNNITKANIAFNVITLVTVCVRMIVRTRMLGLFGKEDWAMVVTTILYTSQSIVVFMFSRTGHQMLSGDNTVLDTFFRLITFGNGLFALTMVALKLSLGFFFLRIVGHMRPQRYTILALMTLSTMAGLAYFGIATFTCAQVRDTSVFTGEKCAVQTASDYVYTVFASINALSDLTMVLIALFALWRANLPVVTKMVAGSLLALGCIGGVASIVRLVIVLEPTDAFGYLSQMFNVGLWVMIELAVGIIAANLALMRPLFQLFLEKTHLITTSKTRTATGVSTIGHARARPNMTTRSRSEQDVDDMDDVLLSDIRKDTTIVIVDMEERGLGQKYAPFDDRDDIRPHRQ